MWNVYISTRVRITGNDKWRRRTIACATPRAGMSEREREGDRGTQGMRRWCQGQLLLTPQALCPLSSSMIFAAGEGGGQGDTRNEEVVSRLTPTYTPSLVPTEFLA